MPWHFTQQKGLNPKTPDERKEEIRKVVEDRHKGKLSGFGLSDDAKKSYALIKTPPGDIGAIRRELQAESVITLDEV